MRKFLKKICALRITVLFFIYTLIAVLRDKELFNLLLSIYSDKNLSRYEINCLLFCAMSDYFRENDLNAFNKLHSLSTFYRTLK